MKKSSESWFYFPGWVVHPYLLFGIFVLLVFGAGFLTGSLLT